MSILVLLSVMLYIMLAHSMMFAALSNAICSYNAFFIFLLPFIFENAVCFHAFSWFIDT